MITKVYHPGHIVVFFLQSSVGLVQRHILVFLKPTWGGRGYLKPSFLTCLMAHLSVYLEILWYNHHLPSYCLACNFLL